MSGADSSTLTLTNVQPQDEGSYYCVVSNTYGTTESMPAYIGVLSATATPTPTPVLTATPTATATPDRATDAHGHTKRHPHGDTDRHARRYQHPDSDRHAHGHNHPDSAGRPKPRLRRPQPRRPLREMDAEQVVTIDADEHFYLAVYNLTQGQFDSQHDGAAPVAHAFQMPSACWIGVYMYNYSAAVYEQALYVYRE